MLQRSTLGVFMRYRLAAAAALALLSVPAAAANKGSGAMTACAASWKAMSKADQGKTTYRAYSSSCMKAGGHSAAAAPTVATPVAMAGHATPQNRMKACAAKWDGMKKDGTAKGTTYKAFSATCLKKS
jgi:hypothetical protein